MNKLAIVQQAYSLKLERLESNVRRHEQILAELLRDCGVLNRKVEKIHDELEAENFLQEEIPLEADFEEVLPRAVTRVSETRAQAGAAGEATDNGDL